MTVSELTNKIELCNKKIKNVNTESSKRQGRKEQLIAQQEQEIKNYKELFGVELNVNDRKQIEEEFKKVTQEKIKEIEKMEKALDLIENGKFIELNALLGIQKETTKQKTGQQLTYHTPDNAFVITTDKKEKSEKVIEQLEQADMEIPEEYEEETEGYTSEEDDYEEETEEETEEEFEEEIEEETKEEYEEEVENKDILDKKKESNKVIEAIKNMEMPEPITQKTSAPKISVGNKVAIKVGNSAVESNKNVVKVKVQTSNELQTESNTIFTPDNNSSSNIPDFSKLVNGTVFEP